MSTTTSGGERERQKMTELLSVCWYVLRKVVAEVT